MKAIFSRYLFTGITLALILGFSHSVLLYGQDDTGAGGSEDSGSTSDSSVDLSAVDQTNRAFKMYTLSYIDSDRLLAVLKALGYPVIEFTTGPGDSTTSLSYTPSGGEIKSLPYIIKMIDPVKSSLLDPDPFDPLAVALAQSGGGGYGGGGGMVSSVPEIGGEYLHHTTSGEPSQRILIVYDRRKPEALESLVRLVQETIDVPARQVVIEALVVELDTDKARDLGVSYSGSRDQYTYTFGETTTGCTDNPFIGTYDDLLSEKEGEFQARLEALIEDGEAEVLSSPSVLVLDGRQAIIQIAQQVPVTKQVQLPNQTSVSDVEYIPVGIVLNLRPRINQDGSEITMQVETIVSSTLSVAGTANSIVNAPVIDSRKVQSFVRVTNNKPFIIGGLIKTSEIVSRRGVPGLSELPIMGALFRTTNTTYEKKEVIIVLTPHVMPTDEKSFTYTIPKDYEIFDSFDKILFRNHYRLRQSDVYDLSFLYETAAITKLVDTVRGRASTDAGIAIDPEFAHIVKGGVPGEEILIRRMLYEVISDKLGYDKHIDTEKIIFFEPRQNSPGMKVRFLKDYLSRMDDADNTLGLLFGPNTEAADDTDLRPPTPTVTYEYLASKSDYRERVIALNTVGRGEDQQRAILLSKVSKGLNRLKAVLVLKRLLEVNQTLPLTLTDFKAGTQIVFPDRKVLADRHHVISKEVAQYFYEVYNYYGAFQDDFYTKSKLLMDRLEE